MIAAITPNTALLLLFLLLKKNPFLGTLALRFCRFKIAAHLPIHNFVSNFFGENYCRAFPGLAVWNLLIIAHFRL